MREDNIQLGNYLANIYDKKYGVITYSGTLAIETVLKSLNLNVGDKVLISNNVCYSILNAILQCKLTPVIVCPENDLVLTANDILPILKEHDIKAIIVVHQYGIVNDVEQIRKIYKDGIIIEDVAQAWNITINSNKAGKYSDYIITSFGTTKPLSYGIGGAIYSNNNFVKYIDFCDNESRENENEILPYAYPLCKNIKIDELILNANKIILNQRKISKSILKLLENQSIINCYIDNNNDESTWHRFPIWVYTEKMYFNIIQILNEMNVEYQTLHNTELKDLNLANRSIVIDNRKETKYFILIRTRNVSKSIVEIAIKKIIHKLL